jgi:signal transduction histidine kinase
MKTELEKLPKWVQDLFRVMEPPAEAIPDSDVRFFAQAITAILLVMASAFTFLGVCVLVYGDELLTYSFGRCVLTVLGILGVCLCMRSSNYLIYFRLLLALFLILVANQSRLWYSPADSARSLIFYNSTEAFLFLSSTLFLSFRDMIGFMMFGMAITLSMPVWLPGVPRSVVIDLFTAQFRFIWIIFIVSFLLRTTLKATRASRDAARRALEIKTQFVSNMSHEIRTPLNGIIGKVLQIGLSLRS